MIITIKRLHINRYLLILVYFILMLAIVYTLVYTNIHYYISAVYLSSSYSDLYHVEYNTILKNISIFQNYIFSYFSDKTSLSMASFISNKLSMNEIANEISVVQMLLYDSSRDATKSTFHLI